MGAEVVLVSGSVVFCKVCVGVSLLMSGAAHGDSLLTAKEVFNSSLLLKSGASTQQKTKKQTMSAVG